MAYTTLAKIKSMFRDIKIEAADTAVIESEITQWITETDSIISAKLSAYYITPITGTESLNILSRIATLYVAHNVKTILESTSAMSDKEQDVQTNLEKKADKLLNELLTQYNKSSKSWEKPIMPLPDAVIIAAPPTSASIFNSQYDGTQVPTITKGGDNW